MDVPALAASNGCFAEKDIICDITVKEPEIIVTIYVVVPMSTLGNNPKHPSIVGVSFTAGRITII